MHLRYLITISLASWATAYTTLAQIKDDIVSLDNSVKRLADSTKAYQGGLITAIPPALDFAAVQTRLSKGVADSRLLPPGKLGVSDTQMLVNIVSTTLAVDNPIAVNELKAKKDVIDASAGTEVVLLALKSLLAGHLDFSEQIISRSPESELNSVQNVVDIITIALQDGINTFSS